MNIQLPKGVNNIINHLISHGFEAYAVGGCIRDSIIGVQPEDWDITTSANPSEVKRIFKRTVDTGIKHGTVTVLQGDNSYEITTYRIDGEYEDHRHPKTIEFTSDLAKDLQRRDFTINAMAYNNQKGLVDLYGGIHDLQEGVIRCVGSPLDRFEEDALRILRAFRFSAQLNFKIEEETYKAACKKKENLRDISVERIRTELNKLLLSNNPEKLIDLYNAGITGTIFAEFDDMMDTPHEETEGESVASHGVKILQTLPVNRRHENNKIALISHWTLLLHEVDVKNDIKDSSKLAKKILKRFKFDNDTIDKTTQLIKYIHIPFTLSEYSMRKAINDIGKDQMDLLFFVKTAKFKTFHNHEYKNQLENIYQARDIYNKIIKRGDCTNLSMLEIDGKDLISLGYKPGKDLGNTLNYLLDLILQDPNLNKKQTLLDMAKNIIEEKSNNLK